MNDGKKSAREESDMNIVKQLINRKFLDLFTGAKSCSTRMIDDQMFECKVKKPNPQYCEHSLSMGGGFVCKHPDRRDFVDK